MPPANLFFECKLKMKIASARTCFYKHPECGFDSFIQSGVFSRRNLVDALLKNWFSLEAALNLVFYSCRYLMMQMFAAG